MNPGNLIIHLPLQARNLAVTLESDLSLSHPTSSPLPSSVESSPKYLLDATPPLHCHSLCPGSAPQPLALRNHHQRFRTTSPAAGCNMATWGMVLHRTAAVQVGSSPSPFRGWSPTLWDGTQRCSGPSFGLLFQPLFLPYTPVPFAPYLCMFLTHPNVPSYFQHFGHGPPILLLVYLAHSSSKAQLHQGPPVSPFELNWESSCGLLWLSCICTGLTEPYRSPLCAGSCCPVAILLPLALPPPLEAMPDPQKSPNEQLLNECTNAKMKQWIFILLYHWVAVRVWRQ